MHNDTENYYMHNDIDYTHHTAYRREDATWHHGFHIQNQTFSNVSAMHICHIIIHICHIIIRIHNQTFSKVSARLKTNFLQVSALLKTQDTFTFGYVSMFTFIYIYICMYTHIYVYICIYIYHIRKRQHVHMHICVYICILYTYISIHIAHFVHTHILKRQHFHILKHEHVYILQRQLPSTCPVRI